MKTFYKIRVLFKTCLAGVILFSSPLGQANTDMLKGLPSHEVTPTNISFVSQKLSEQPLDDLSEYFPSSPGSYTYQIFHHEKNTVEHIAENQTMVTANSEGEKWHRKIEDTLVEEWRTDDHGNVLLTAKLVEDHGFRVELETPIMLLNTTPIGYSWNLNSKLNAYKLGNPSTVAHEGSLNISGKYVGKFKIRTPIGEVPTILLSEQIDFKLGLVDVQSNRYRFYTRGIGKVAEVEGRKVSALFFYRDKSQYTKIIEQLPGNLQAQALDNPTDVRI